MIQLLVNLGVRALGDGAGGWASWSRSGSSDSEDSRRLGHSQKRLNLSEEEALVSNRLAVRTVERYNNGAVIERAASESWLRLWNNHQLGISSAIPSVRHLRGFDSAAKPKSKLENEYT